MSNLEIDVIDDLVETDKYMIRILYIIPFRGKNLYRKKNLKIVIQWIKLVQKYLNDKYDILMDLIIVEQDREPFDQTPKEGLTHIFLKNTGMFNKGWGFNVAVKQYPSYHYYGFGDADIIIPDIEKLCDFIASSTIITPQKAFRPFTDRFNTLLSDCATINSFDELVRVFPITKPKLAKHGGLSFASNMIFMSRETYEQIGGWDEVFKGWGRFDDFITHKLTFVCQCTGFCAQLDAIHLWHPITLDYSLASSPENIQLYDKYIKYSKNDLLKLIETNYKTIGDTHRYDK